MVSEQFIHKLSEDEKQKVRFLFFLQNQSLTAIDFGGTSLCRRNV